MTQNLNKYAWFGFLFSAFLNAFNDLGHKIMIQNILYETFDGTSQVVWTTILNLLILVPFVIFSNQSGHFSDSIHKQDVMQNFAKYGIFISIFLSFCYFFGSFWFAFFGTFLLGVQAAFYSPAKFGFISQVADKDKLNFLNGQLQAVSISAILFGILAYSALFEYFAKVENTNNILQSIWPLSCLIILGFLAEYFFLKKLVNPLTTKIQIVDTNFDNSKYFNVSLALGLIFGISQSILAVFPAFAKANFGNPSVLAVQATLAISLIGIISGALGASKITKNKIDLSIVMFAGLIFAFGAIMLPFSSCLSQASFFTFLIGFGSGLAISILYSWLNFFGEVENQGKIIAYSNYIQNISMILFLLFALFASFFEVSPFILLVILGLASIIAILFNVVKNIDIFLYGLVCFIFRLRYKIIVINHDNIPTNGGVILAGNHVSWIDWAILAIACDRKLIFLIDGDIYENRFLNWFLALQRTIPVLPQSSTSSIKQAVKMLEIGEIVVIFPEGAISNNCKLSNIKNGTALISKISKLPVNAFFIKGVCGSIFARGEKNKSAKWFRREIKVEFTKPFFVVSEKILEEKLIEMQNNE
jgi:acyl-[acyl-carrier-protein]-phospholipid O-acyltransferase/long-chain-fatty-acid--[acyl-carrier-protein] ligase